MFSHGSFSVCIHLPFPEPEVKSWLGGRRHGGSGSPEKRGSGPVLPRGNTVPATHTIPDCLAAALKRWEATSENYWSNIFYLTQYIQNIMIVL